MKYFILEKQWNGVNCMKVHANLISECILIDAVVPALEVNRVIKKDGTAYRRSLGVYYSWFYFGKE